LASATSSPSEGAAVSKNIYFDCVPREESPKDSETLARIYRASITSGN